MISAHLFSTSKSRSAVGHNCRGGPPWPPQVCHIVFLRWGGHGVPPYSCGQRDPSILHVRSCSCHPRLIVRTGSTGEFRISVAESRFPIGIREAANRNVTSVVEKRVVAVIEVT